MKKSTFIKEYLLPVLTSRNNGHYSYDAQTHAELIIKTFEQSGVLDDLKKVTVTYRDLELIPYEDSLTAFRWDDE